MADREEAAQAIIDRVAESAPGASAVTLLRLAEALAWARCPDQPHGSSEAS